MTQPYNPNDVLLLKKELHARYREADTRQYKTLLLFGDDIKQIEIGRRQYSIDWQVLVRLGAEDFCDHWEWMNDETRAFLRNAGMPIIIINDQEWVDCRACAEWIDRLFVRVKESQVKTL